MKKIFSLILGTVLLAAPVFAGQQLVNLPLTSTLTDTKSNLTAGSLIRNSDATYVNTAGTLAYSRGTRINYLLYSEDTSNAAWVGGTVQTVAVSLGTYSLAVYKTAATLTAAATTAAITPLAGLVASVGTPIYFTVTTAGNITITTNTTNPKGSLEKLPSGNVIGSDLMDQESLSATEKITNGDFSSSTGWTLSGGAAISGGTLTLTVASGGMQYAYRSDADLTADTLYKAVMVVTSVTGTGSVNLCYNAGDNLTPIPTWNSTISAAGTYTSYFYATSTYIDIGIKRVTASGDYTVVIDSLSIKEVTSHAKGSFHDVAMLAGSTELVTNGGFETITDAGPPVNFGTWSETKGGTDTITDPAAGYLGSHSATLTNVDSGVTFVDQDIVTTAGKLYKLEFYTKGDATVGGRYHVYDNTGAADIVAIAATGVTAATYTKVTKYFYTPASCVSVKISLYAPSAAGTAYFDYVSVRQVQTAWTRYGTNTMEIDPAVGSGGALKFLGDGSNATAGLVYINGTELSSNLVVGETYQVSFKAKVSAAGSVNFGCYGAADLVPAVAITENDLTTKIFYFKADHATTDYIYFNGLGNTESVWIDDLTIKSVPDLAYLSPGTYTATAGSTATIPAEPRFEANGLLVEGEATNLIYYSSGNSGWDNGGSITRTANQVGFTGSTNGVLVSVANDADSWIILNASDRMVNKTNGVFCASLFMKPHSNFSTPWVFLSIETPGGGSGGVVAWVNLLTGSIGTTDAGIIGTKVYADGWIRIWIATTVAGSPSAINFVLSPSEADGSNTLSVNSGAWAYIDGRQTERTLFPTSYIPTNGCPVTRLTEAGSATNGYSWTKAAAIDTALGVKGTVLLDYIPGHAAAGGTGTGSGILSFTNSATGLIYYDYTNTNFESADGTNTPENDESIANGTTYTLAVRWDETADGGAGFLKVSEKHGGTWTHGTATAFDGAFVITGTKAYIGYGNEYPFWIKNIKFFDGWVKDANLDHPVGGGLFPPIPVFDTVRAYEY